MGGETLIAERYRLDRQIGAGGMGRVWAARDMVLNRDVAVKLHHLDPADGRAELERFLVEARATAALQHPNVVTVYDSGTDGDQAFLVMELLPGPTLQAYVTEHDPLPEPEAVALAVQIASGVAAAHGAGVVHRDIKPSNVMFDAAGTVKIVDFGIARLTQATATGLTIANAVIGSPPYLSPEQFQGAPADERSDLYALGCVLTTLLTGRPPFQGEHPLAYGHQHVYVPPPAVSERRPDVDPDLEALVGKLLTKDPRDRPGSALEVLQQLTAERATAERATAERAGSGPIPAEPTTAALPLSGTRTRRRSRTARWVLAAALTPTVTAIALATGATTADTPTATVAAAGRASGGNHQHAPQPVPGQHTPARTRAATTNSPATVRSDTDNGQQSGSARDVQEGAGSKPPRGSVKANGSQEAAAGPKAAGHNLTGEKNGGPENNRPTKHRPGKGGPQNTRHKQPRHKATGQKAGSHASHSHPSRTR